MAIVNGASRNWVAVDDRLDNGGVVLVGIHWLRAQTQRHDPGAMRLVRYLLDNRGEATVPPKRDKKLVEARIGTAPGGEIVCTQGCVHVGHRLVKIRDLVRAGALACGGLSCGSLEGRQNFVDFGKRFRRDWQNAHAVARAQLNHSFLFKPNHRLAHGSSAHPQTRGRLLFQNLASCGKFVVEDELLQITIRPLARRHASIVK